jgi:hypothetical protein
MARRAAAEWATLVERWRRSGLQGPAFAAREGVRVEQLRWWKWHLGKSDVDAPRPAPSAAMVRVEVRPPRADDTVTSAAIEILRDGWTVRVASGCDVGLLSEVLDALASRATC